MSYIGLTAISSGSNNQAVNTFMTRYDRSTSLTCCMNDKASAAVLLYRPTVNVPAVIGSGMLSPPTTALTAPPEYQRAASMAASQRHQLVSLWICNIITNTGTARLHTQSQPIHSPVLSTSLAGRYIVLDPY